MNVDSLVTLSIHWFLAAVFALAFDHKITDFPRFAAVLRAWRIVPQQATHGVAYAVSIAEFITVITNLLAMRVGLLFAAMILLAYATGMQINRRRGRSFIDCGCGDEPVPLTAGLLVRQPRSGRNVALRCPAGPGLRAVTRCAAHHRGEPDKHRGPAFESGRRCCGAAD